MTSRLLTGTAAVVLALIGPLAGFSAAPAARKPPNAGAKAISPASAAAGAADPAKFFDTEVKSVLQQNCVSCHSGDKPQGGLRLTSRDAILKGGSSGPAVSPGKPASSLLIAAINYEGRQMPPQGKLAQPKIDALTRWVSQGAPWPAGVQSSLEPPVAHSGPPPVTPETMRFWSFQPVKRPEIPSVKNKAWVRSPIDAFVLRRLEDAGLKPSPPAGKASLVRRAYYDMLGLPPSPEEVRAFVSDASPDAWEKVVDRLLASPRYGERWGRHWLDLVHFAESNSYERDGTKPYAWRYRDYVIDAFNQDKPYDQFITEQLAGDELPDRTPEKIIATGYYRLGIWDDEPVDPQQALYDDLDDITSTTGQVFLGLTVGCARCHDHKLDPFPQKDYYRLVAFFNGINRYGVRSFDTIAAASLRRIGPAEEGRRQDAEIAAHEAKVKASREQAEPIEQKLLPALTTAEKEEWRNPDRRLEIAKKHLGAGIEQADLDRYAALVEARKALEKFEPAPVAMALAVTEQGPAARETHVLLRGSARAEGDLVQPGFPSVLAPPQPEIRPSPYGESSGRRLALARWIGSRENPLTARVLANRVWQYHFGRGIVRSTSNFGFQGDKPTHPELLDWLASTLAADWKLKPLHRLILLSNAYRMSSQANPVALKKDPENDLLWRFDMRRLEAEEIRDSILAANGSLNLKMGGPSIYPTIPAEVLAGQSVPGQNWGKSTPEEQRRRSVYIFVKRSLALPIVASFDGPETDLSCSARFATTQPTQALGMMNSAFLNEQARVFAAYLKKQAGEQPAEQVKLALWRVLQRSPTPAEIARGVKLIERLKAEEKVSADDALADFCLVALNLNEFLYLD